MTKLKWIDPKLWTPERIMSADLTQETKSNMGWLYERNRRVITIPVGTADLVTTDFTVARIPMFLTDVTDVRLILNVQFSSTNTAQWVIFNFFRRPSLSQANIAASAKTDGMFSYRINGAATRKHRKMAYIWRDVPAGQMLFSANVEIRGTGNATVHYDQVPGFFSVEELGL